MSRVLLGSIQRGLSRPSKKSQRPHPHQRRAPCALWISSTSRPHQWESRRSTTVRISVRNRDHAIRDRSVEAGGEIVQDDDLLMADVEEHLHHVAADVAGTTRHQNRHLTPSAPTPAPAYAFADGKFTPRHLILSTYMLATVRVKLSH